MTCAAAKYDDNDGDDEDDDVKNCGNDDDDDDDDDDEDEDEDEDDDGDGDDDDDADDADARGDAGGGSGSGGGGGGCEHGQLYHFFFEYPAGCGSTVPKSSNFITTFTPFIPYENSPCSSIFINFIPYSSMFIHISIFISINPH